MLASQLRHLEVPVKLVYTEIALNIALINLVLERIVLLKGLHISWEIN